jgi:hypothetical protein
LADFNNDGFKDVTYMSAEAARGANEIRRLFMYNREKDQLVYIKNSDQYPNLEYKTSCRTHRINLFQSLGFIAIFFTPMVVIGIFTYYLLVSATLHVFSLFMFLILPINLPYNTLS